MAGPWEKFQTPSTEAKPWEKFQEVKPAAEPTPEPPSRSFGMSMSQHALNALAGGVRGAGSIGSTLLAPFDIAKDALAGKGLSLESNRARRAAMDDFMRDQGAETDSKVYGGSQLLTEIGGTMGAGGAMANAARAAAPGFAASVTGAKALNALGSAGFTTGAPAAATFGWRAADLGIRSLAGGANGAVSAGMVDPENAAFGGGIGAVLPGAALAAGRTGQYLGKKFGGGGATPEMEAQILAARQAGYVIPPTQAKPSLGNRILEGFAGKLTTAQNASAKNQGVTNRLAAKALGVDDLSPASLSHVRSQADAGYEQIKAVGPLATDDAFRASLKKAGEMSEQMRRDFPNLVNTEVDDLVTSLTASQGFDSRSAIEAIKQFRFQGSANKANMDPAKKALGSAQMKISNALEDMIDRNLQQRGVPELLDNYRSARTTFAKLYDVEKALNETSRNVDPAKLAKLLGKGRPLTGELKQIAEFTQTFPKASRAVEGMGSLPGVSPLDFGALGTVSAITANPWLMAGVAARPAARAAALSGMVQNRLLPGQPGYLEQLMNNPQAQQLMYRTAPNIGQD